MAEEPLCRMCSDRGDIVGGTQVDHILPHKGNADLFFNYENTQTLCDHCHASIKHSHELTRFKPVGPDGWPVR